MTIIQRAGLLALATLMLSPATGEAKSREEYRRETDRWLNQGRYESALRLIQDGLGEYPGDIDLTIARAEIEYVNRDYVDAIASYIRILDQLTRYGEAKSTLIRHHENLIRAYIRLGHQHLFSRELCLRIIYHQEKIFELDPEIADQEHSLKTLNGIMNYYEIADAGAKVIKVGGSGDDVTLPDDAIPATEKQRYLKKARKRLNRTG